MRSETIETIGEVLSTFPVLYSGQLNYRINEFKEKFFSITFFNNTSEFKVDFAEDNFTREELTKILNNYLSGLIGFDLYIYKLIADCIKKLNHILITENIDLEVRVNCNCILEIRLISGTKCYTIVLDTNELNNRRAPETVYNEILYGLHMMGYQ